MRIFHAEQGHDDFGIGSSMAAWDEAAQLRTWPANDKTSAKPRENTGKCEQIKYRLEKVTVVMIYHLSFLDRLKGTCASTHLFGGKTVVFGTRILPYNNQSIETIDPHNWSIFTCLKPAVLKDENAQPYPNQRC